MSADLSANATFSDLVDLAAAALGGQALATSDEFFAGAENLVQPGRGVFIDGKFTDRGKWMDGWESRRKRGAGHDWCILALGVPGEVQGLDIDTHFFVGNHPSFASVDGLYAPGLRDEAILASRSDWTELLTQVPLRPNAQNLFAARPRDPVSHVRLNIFPDGGVARFRVFGRVKPSWEVPATARPTPDADATAAARVPPDLDDLAALVNGGSALACSDAFFGPMNNLLLPGRAENMGGGWETKRRRGAGFDWILIRLGGRGLPGFLEIDTNHFKGNYPDRCSVEIIDAAGARITDLLGHPGWRTLLPESRLAADTRHFFDVTSGGTGPATHVRLNIFPDGGVSRLRVWGQRDG